VTISTAQRNPTGDSAEQIVAQARALRAQYLVSVSAKAWRMFASVFVALRAANARREARQALSMLDRHTLTDVGLDRFVGDIGVPANENRPRHVA
jgi:uncharacterized protein YjiS (DUF1127 family)